MNAKVSAGKVRRTVLTDNEIAVAIGVALSTAVTLYVFMTGSIGMEYPAFAGGAAGGLVAGVVLGKNTVDGGAIGFRVGAISGAIAAATIATVMFIAWSQGSEIYPQYSFTYFATFFILFVPLNGFTGTIGGALGTTLRRFTLPTEYNPPPY